MKKKILTIFTCGMLAISMSAGVIQPVTVFADDWDDWDDWDGLYYDDDDDFEAMVIYGSMLDEEARRLEEQRKRQEKERKKLEKERKKLEDERRTSYGIAHSSSTRVNGILVSTNVLNLDVGQVSQVGVQVIPENASNRGVTLYSSNPAVAVVDMYANVRAVGPGTATIYAVTNEGGFTQQIFVNVMNYPMAKHVTP